MKKILLFFILLAIALPLSSCSDISILDDDNAKIADKTFSEIVDAIKSKDESKIVDMFADSIKSEDGLSQTALAFIDYIRGDIISFSSADEAGVGADYKIEDGKKRKEIQSSFLLTTTESAYFIAIKERVKDEFNENTGIMSIYVIDAKDWSEDFVYRGDGMWAQGITIEDADLKK